MNPQEENPAARLKRLLMEAGLAPLDLQTAAQFERYLSLIIRWNARINLTAIRDEAGIQSRHFVESIACARALPEGIRTLLDFGSGAGLPGIPIALCRPEIYVTLSESQGKKAAFLQEAIRVLAVPASVHPGRAELLDSKFDCVTLRAVDRMPDAVRVAASRIAADGWLALMTSKGDLERLEFAAGGGFEWRSEIPLPVAESRVLALAQRRAAIL
jgi:16S rRNA (guanine527-N7)-methyltransferase